MGILSRWFGSGSNNESTNQETERLDELTDRKELTNDEQLEFEALMKMHYPGYSSEDE